MRAYTIALALFAFGFVTGCINGIGLFDVMLPGSDMTISESQVTEITDGATSGGASPLYSISILLTLGKVLWEGLKTALALSVLLCSYGVDPLVALMFQGPIWFVYIVGLVQFFTGRSLKGVE